MTAPSPPPSAASARAGADAGSQTLQLFERLRSAVLNLDLMPGERLTERGLEAAYHASRTPVRAALMRLETEGLAQRDGRGWIVAPIDIDEIRALAELREAVETAAVRLAVQRASDSDIAGLAELLETARPTEDEEEVVRAGGDFHVELASLAGNAPMTDAVRGAMTRLARTRWLEVRTPDSREHAWNEHRAVVAALRARDASLASELLATHIRSTNERLVEHLAGERRRLRARGLSIVESPTRPAS
ncbi:GntR family transcriptional regulator [Herbiconiux ginsengi]|uniref:Transcriptional regulator, GntR family n=1 Tax=Herbiconiux ginsengi TaxID=381665 RepID=A0A1H3LCA2_9MICO|nr:GntR family transcriptional regulator [Herbiconiux ginsengi]SDY61574.1 transcriptional regulator, GntR family [Herbiconiux ginsengi]